MAVKPLTFGGKTATFLGGFEEVDFEENDAGRSGYG
jgi:hypothetical protein